MLKYFSVKIVSVVSTLAAASVFGAANIHAAPSDLDGSFGEGGIVIADIGGSRSTDTASALIIQQDGKLVIAGTGYIAEEGRGRFALVRHNADGELDNSFGTASIVITSVEGHGYGAAYALAVQPDDKFVVAGFAHTSGL